MSYATDVRLGVLTPQVSHLPPDVHSLGAALETIDLAELFIVGRVTVRQMTGEEPSLTVTRTTHHKCGRCWRHLPEVTEDGALCSRCDQVVAGMDAAHV